MHDDQTSRRAPEPASPSLHRAHLAELPPRFDARIAYGYDPEADGSYHPDPEDYPAATSRGPWPDDDPASQTTTPDTDPDGPGREPADGSGHAARRKPLLLLAAAVIVLFAAAGISLHLISTGDAPGGSVPALSTPGRQDPPAEVQEPSRAGTAAPGAEPATSPTFAPTVPAAPPAAGHDDEPDEDDD